MKYNLQQLSDRFEIQDILVDYSRCIDRKDWQGLDRVFTQDAFIDYTVMGGPKGSLAEIKQFLSDAMALFSATQHAISNFEIVLNGDSATGRIMCFNPQVLNLGEDQQYTFFIGLWYIDEYVRTAEGWRIRSRIEEKSYDFNVPDFIKIEAKA